MMCTIQKIEVCNDIEGSMCVAIFYSSTTKWLSSHNFTDIVGRTLPSSVLLPHLFEAIYSGRWSWPAFYAWEHCLPSSASLPPDFPSHLQHRHTHMHIYAHVCTHSGIHLTYSLMHSNLHGTCTHMATHATLTLYVQLSLQSTQGCWSLGLTPGSLLLVNPLTQATRRQQHTTSCGDKCCIILTPN